MELPSKGKIDFIKEVFTTCEMTQTFIFVNTRKFAEIVNNTLRKDGLQSEIMYGKLEKDGSNCHYKPLNNLNNVTLFIKEATLNVFEEL